MVVLGRDLGDLLPGGAPGLHVQPGGDGIGVHEDRARPLVVDHAVGRDDIGDHRRIGSHEGSHRREVVGLAEGRQALVAIGGVELLGAHGQGDLGETAGHLHEGQVQGGGRAGAGVLDVEERRAADAQGPERMLPLDPVLALDRPLGGVGVDDRLEIARPGARVGKGGRHRLAGQVGGRAFQVLSEAGHADTDDEHLAHDRRSPAHFDGKRKVGYSPAGAAAELAAPGTVTIVSIEASPVSEGAACSWPASRSKAVTGSASVSTTTIWSTWPWPPAWPGRAR